MRYLAYLWARASPRLKQQTKHADGQEMFKRRLRPSFVNVSYLRLPLSLWGADDGRLGAKPDIVSKLKHDHVQDSLQIRYVQPSGRGEVLLFYACRLL